MNPDPYSTLVREYFADPQHAGDIPGGAAGYVAEQGIRVRFSADIANDAIATMRFMAWSCPHVIAAAEAICRHYEGRSPRELEGFESAQIMQTLAIPPEKTGRILVVEDALRSLRLAIRERD